MIETSAFKHNFNFKTTTIDLQGQKKPAPVQSTPLHTNVKDGVIIHVSESRFPQPPAYSKLDPNTLQQSAIHQTPKEKFYKEAHKAYYEKLNSLIADKKPEEQTRLRELDRTARKATSEIYNDPGTYDLPQNPRMKRNDVDARLKESQRKWSQLGSKEDVSELRKLDKALFYCDLEVKIEAQEAKVKEIERRGNNAEVLTEAVRERYKLAVLQHLKVYQQYRDKEVGLTQNDEASRKADQKARNLLWFRWYNDSLESPQQETERLTNATEEWMKIPGTTPKKIEELHSLWAQVFHFHTKREVEILDVKANGLQGRLTRVLQGENLNVAKALGSDSMPESREEPKSGTPSKTNPGYPLPGARPAMFMNPSPAQAALLVLILRKLPT